MYIDRESICAGGQQELSAARVLEQCTLLVAQVKCALELGRLPRPLRTEEEHGGVRSHDGSGVRAQQVTGILRCKHERTAVLADAPGQADDEPSYRRVLEKQPELVDDEHSPAVLPLDPRP